MSASLPSPSPHTQLLPACSALSRRPSLPPPAGVPRLFVGQIPTVCTEEEILPVFSSYGDIEKVSLVRGPDNKSRGCCMVGHRCRLALPRLPCLRIGSASRLLPAAPC